jgi:hypothetical protein
MLKKSIEPTYNVNRLNSGRTGRWGGPVLGKRRRTQLSASTPSSHAPKTSESTKYTIETTGMAHHTVCAPRTSSGLRTM